MSNEREEAIMLSVEVTVLDRRLIRWGFPAQARGAGIRLHACVPEPLVLEPRCAPLVIPAGFAIRIRDPGCCAWIVPPAIASAKKGLALGPVTGLADPAFDGACELSVWNRNERDSVSPDRGIVRIDPGDWIAQLGFA